ncbi:MAG: aminomethyl-transferring glycine dehydrogenase subunit GcvPB [Spirochaetota bacterium]|nr:aminomethyl-transferring glycine dehydrogenase subunit GcvPB [Spirochaetota bacterium]
MEKNIFNKSKKSRRGIVFPKLDVEESNIPSWIKRDNEIGLPSVSELDVVRHFTKLSQKNFSVDTNFYPLGSCTMKYNPKINEFAASLDGFLNVHPYQEIFQIQGALEVIYELEQALAKITGLPYVTLSPNAGAHGEFVGVSLIKKYFESKNDPRNIAIIPDSAHGTNPASAAMIGFKTVQVKSNPEGTVDISHLKELISKDVACIMLTNPNTLGLFEKDILEISKIMKQNGSLLYYDGANLNAIVGKVRPSDMGFDVMHINLHKTFSTPHGGGGPGSGPVCVSERLKDFLPNPIISKRLNKDKYEFFIQNPSESSISRVRWFFGNFLVLLKAYVYIISLGKNGLKMVSERAVLNANYLKNKLKNIFPVPYNDHCMHEFVISIKNLKSQTGVTASDIAKRLIDYGIHPPTVYFPLIVQEAMMIEPTETESKEILDDFISVMETIYKESLNDNTMLKDAPFKTRLSRLDEAKAVKEPKLTL